MSESKQERCRRLNKQIARLAPADAASMRDENEKLQARVAELECMVKVFRGCIDTQTLPGQGGRCHKRAYDLVGEPDDDGSDK